MQAGAVERDAAERDPGVGQREHRHHAERDDRVQLVQQVLDRRHRLAARVLDGVEPGQHLVARDAIVELPQVLAGHLREAGSPEPRPHRRRQAEDHAGQRGVHAGDVEPDPHRDARAEVGPDRAHAEPTQHRARDDPTEGDGQTAAVDAAGVEQRDHDDRAEVIDHRQRQEQHAQAAWHPAAEHRDHADRERDVGGHRDGPPTRALAARVERDVDQRGHHHAAERRGERQRGAPDIRQIPLVQLAAQLESDHEEEHGHEPVVDPEVQRAHEGPVADLEADRRVPQRVVGVGPRRVGPAERDRCDDDEHDAAGGLDGEEPLQRVDQTGRRLARARPGLGRERINGAIGVHEEPTERRRPDRRDTCSDHRCTRRLCSMGVRPYHLGLRRSPSRGNSFDLKRFEGCDHQVAGAGLVGPPAVMWRLHA